MRLLLLRWLCSGGASECLIGSDVDPTDVAEPVPYPMQPSVLTGLKKYDRLGSRGRRLTQGIATFPVKGDQAPN